MKKKTTIHIVRHGQSHGNVDPQNSGPDPGLTEEGKKQVRKRAHLLRNKPFDVIYTSHLKRAQETAALLKGGRDTEIKIFPSLEERDFGDLFDRPDVMEQLMSLDGILDSMNDEERWDYKYIPTMESEKEAIDRFIAALRYIAGEHSGQNILVIGHGNLIRTLLVRLGEATFFELPHASFENAGYLRLGTDGESFVLEEIIGLTKRNKI